MIKVSDLTRLLLLKFQNEQLSVFECCEKYPDSNVYTDWNWWFACEYKKWLKLTNELYEVM